MKGANGLPAADCEQVGFVKRLGRREMLRTDTLLTSSGGPVYKS